MKNGWKGGTFRSPESNDALPLLTKRLHLRHFQDSDLESFLAYRNDPEVAKYQSWKIPNPQVKGEEFIKEMKAALSGTPGQ